MRKFALILALISALFTTSAVADTVNFQMTWNQPTLFDRSQRDTFSGSVDDRSGTTTLEVICSVGASGRMGFGRVDETCAVSGNGIIKHPDNPSQTLPRMNFGGGFVVESARDGYTNAATIQANYLRAGSAGAENSTFRGNVVMLPENPPASASQLRDRVLQRMTEVTTGTQAVAFDTRYDSIRFENFIVPHVGLGNTESCGWTGDMVYTYANEAWQASFRVHCGDTTYVLEGNMPLVEAPAGSQHQEEYRLNLINPDSAGGSDPFAEADPFATVNGVVGTFRLFNEGRNVDGVFERGRVNGELTGTGVPLELTRGFGQIMLIFARSFYGT